MKDVNILIVDDNIGLGVSLSFILKKKGYGAVTAEDGDEAVEKVKNTFFDIIIMDIIMPRMNGVETYREIKKINPDPIVFMMTAYAVKELVDQARKEGAYSILNKPLDIDKLLDLIEEVLE